MRNIQSNSYASFTDNILKEWLKIFPADMPAIEPTPEQRLGRVLEKFRNFSDAYAQAVRQLAKENEEYSRLTSAEKSIFDASLEDQIYKALDIYWAPLSQIASQYFSPPYSKVLPKNSELETRTNHFLESINDLVGKNGLKLPGVLVFFDEVTLIHYYPYTDVALVSLPYRVFESGDSIELKSSSIAHELGHYLYWHMADFTDLDEQRRRFMDDLQKKFLKKHGKDEWLFVGPWVEEIFADVVGAWISGETFFNSGKELIRRQNGLDIEKWTENDNEHVPDVLRPFVASYTLQKKGLFNDGAIPWNSFLGVFRIDKERLTISAENTGGKSLLSQLYASVRNNPMNKTPDELIPALQFVVDYLIESIEKFKRGEESQFNFVFSVSVSLDKLKTRAEQIAKMDEQGEDKAYEILLQPTIIEAGQGGERHRHIVLPASIPSWHPFPKPISHRHS